MFGTAKTALYFCRKVRMEGLKNGSMEMPKPP
jgi:hypothetical protein